MVKLRNQKAETHEGSNSEDTSKSTHSPTKKLHHSDLNGTPVKYSERSIDRSRTPRTAFTPTKRDHSPDPSTSLRVLRTPTKRRETSPSLKDTSKLDHTPTKRLLRSDGNATPVKQPECSPDRSRTPRTNRTPTKGDYSTDPSTPLKTLRTPTKRRETSPSSKDILKLDHTPTKRLLRSDGNATPVKQSESSPDRMRKTARTPTKRDHSPDLSSFMKTLRTPTKTRETSPNFKGFEDSSENSPDRFRSRRTVRTPIKSDSPDPTTPSRTLRTPTSSLRTPTTSRTLGAFSNMGTPISEIDLARLKLHVSAIPDTPTGKSSLPGSLVCRENEFKTIHKYIREKISTRSSGYLYISGIPGSGKTATVDRVIKRLQSENRLKVNKFKYVEINGQFLVESSRAYCRILEQMNQEVATAKQAENLLNNIFSSRSSKHTPVILLVDEMDRIYKRSPNVIFNILQWHRKANSQLIVLTIANDDDLISSLKDNFKGKIDITNVQFNSYSDHDLKKIVLDRFQGNNTIEPNAVEFLIKKYASKKGDARKVLDVCRKALDIVAEDHGSVSVVTLKHIQDADEKISTHPYILAIKSCSIAEQILLRAVRDEMCSNEEYSLDERIYFQFQAICTLEGEPCPSIGDVSLVCENLCSLGLLKVNNELVNIHTKMKLNIDADLVNIALQYD